MAIIRVRTVLSGWTGGPGLNTAYFRGSTSTPSQVDCNDVVARVRTFWSAAAGTLSTLASATVQPSVDILDETTGSLSSFRVATPTPLVVVGTAAGDFYAPGIMANFTLETGVSSNGRRVRGRWFVGPIAEGVAGSGILLAANAAQLVTAGAGLIASVPTTSQLIVWSQPRVGRPGFVTNVNGFSCPTKLAHLRSRRDG